MPCSSPTASGLGDVRGEQLAVDERRQRPVLGRGGAVEVGLEELVEPGVGASVLGLALARERSQGLDLRDELALDLVADPRDQDLAQDEDRGRGRDHQQGQEGDQHPGPDAGQQRDALTAAGGLRGLRPAGPGVQQHRANLAGIRRPARATACSRPAQPG